MCFFFFPCACDCYDIPIFPTLLCVGRFRPALAICSSPSTSLLTMPTIASSLVNHIRAALWLLDWPQQAAAQTTNNNSFVSSSTKLVYGLATDQCAYASCSSLVSTSSGSSAGVLSSDYEIDGRTGFVPCSAAVTQEDSGQDGNGNDRKNRLPAAYARWEDALASAPDELALADADDDSVRARRFRASGREWRAQFHQASILLRSPNSFFTDISPDRCLSSTRHRWKRM